VDDAADHDIYLDEMEQQFPSSTSKVSEEAIADVIGIMKALRDATRVSKASRKVAA